MRVLLLAPNGGVSLSTGGGSNFVLKQAKALAAAGHEVVLAGFHALGRDALERSHGVDLGGVRPRVRVVSGGGGFEFAAHRALPGKPSPYFALFDPRVARWMEGLAGRIRPDRVWFHDDVPRAARWAGTVPARLYVHFPLQARTASVVPALRRTRGPGEVAQDAVLRRAAGRIVRTDLRNLVETVHVNSTVTATACRAVWNLRTEVLPTYVPPGAPRTERRPELVSVAAFHRGKGLHDLVDAFREVDSPGARLVLFGHPRDVGYMAQLRRRAAGDRRIVFRPSAPRAELTERLRTAAGIVSAAEFEPFGLAVLEGMSEGAHPIVRRSPASGAWMDLLGAGHLGSGFDGPSDLGGMIAARLAQRPAVPDLAAIRRAAEYSEQRFEESTRSATA